MRLVLKSGQAAEAVGEVMAEAAGETAAAVEAVGKSAYPIQNRLKRGRDPSRSLLFFWRSAPHFIFILFFHFFFRLV